MNRLKIVPVSHELFTQLFSTGFEPRGVVVANALPIDAILVAARTDGRTLFLTYQSNTFEVVPDGCPIPECVPLFKAIASTPC